jgi:hypothetical protein
VSAISANNGENGGPDDGAAVAAARAVMLVRYRLGVVGETARTVHVVPLPTDGQAGAVGTLCGAALMVRDIETVGPGEGMPCIVCVVNHVTSTTPAGEEPPAGTPLTVQALWGLRLVGPATRSGARAGPPAIWAPCGRVHRGHGRRIVAARLEQSECVRVSRCSRYHQGVRRRWR